MRLKDKCSSRYILRDSVRDSFINTEDTDIVIHRAVSDHISNRAFRVTHLLLNVMDRQNFIQLLHKYKHNFNK